MEQLEQSLSPSPSIPSDTSPGSGATNSLASLLSASSYPMPEQIAPRTSQSGGQSPLYGGYGRLLRGNVPSERSRDELAMPVLSKAAAQSTAQRQRRESTTAVVLSPRKRGRPRKTEVRPTDNDRGERRRLQIRQAQRAYRSRKEETLSRYESRIAQLEAALNNMSSAILSFSEHVAYTEALAANHDLQSHLRATVKACRSYTEVLSQTSEGSITPSNSPPTIGDKSPTLFNNTATPAEQSSLATIQPPALSTVSVSPLSIGTLRGFPMPLNPGSPLLFDTATVTVVDLTQFIRQLRLACVYHAYYSLRDTSVKLNDLKRKFRFLLSMLNRESLTSYFEAAVDSTTHPERFVEWQEIPFFSVGGAGTHYPRILSPNSMVGNLSPTFENGSPVQQDPLAPFSSDVQEEMNGVWFNIHDLEGFLQEKKVQLLACPPSSPTQSVLEQTAIKASSLIRLLVSTCICLGRSPGWRRLDVERMLSMAAWT
ncbi:hypothetical protein BDV26DRAFT_270113 [Aspergillus bertholletiae]|uniref:BZIP domain-containing protein n=1 Tax=Aspergillus bertholletiae TaxID=1226010 RepID=A0A5N7AX29_9EURO|nr:hypothetical protein BDV26DRAFT_270113 [Aspergillus bertholletiae]